jgi:hypothetical protein
MPSLGPANNFPSSEAYRQAGSPAPQAQKKGGKVKKFADGGSIDDDVRARAMKWIASGSPEQAAAPSAAVKKAPTKLPMPDYSNEDLDRMDAEAADYERKRESTGLARRYPEKRTPSKMIRDEAEIAQRPTLETKGSKLLKDSGIKINFKRGGKTC